MPGQWTRQCSRSGHHASIVPYVDSPGDEPTGYNDRVLGLLGDIQPHQYPTVEVPGSAFHLVAAVVRVPTVGAMETIIPTWEDASVPLGPYTEADPETEVTRPRNTQLVPGKYASLLIHRQRVKAKQAYTEIVGALRADNALESCADVVTWLRAACTARGGGGPNNVLPSVLHVLTPVHLPADVHQYMVSKVQSDLPGLASASSHTGGTDTAASLVGALRALVCRDGDDVGATREPRTIQDTYKETHKVLLRFCHVTTPDDVAPVWKRLANRSS